MVAVQCSKRKDYTGVQQITNSPILLRKLSSIYKPEDRIGILIKLMEDNI